MRKDVSGFSPESAELLRGHPFAGNVRELRNLVERAAIVCAGGLVKAEDLEFDRPARQGGLRSAFADAQTSALRLSALEEEAIREALQRSGRNQVRAAEILGISRHALRRRVTQYGLAEPD
jgi:two-component system NtrC family response regulator